MTSFKDKVSSLIAAMHRELSWGGAPGRLRLKCYSLETPEVCVRRRRAGESSYTAACAGAVGTGGGFKSQSRTTQHKR